MTSSETLPFIAYRTSTKEPVPIVPADKMRDWMDKTNAHFAYRCLPLLMANQAGWFLLNTTPVQLTWNGKDGPKAIKVEYLEPPEFERVISHFGAGVVTWRIPYLFRTPPGYNLLVRGPANLPKDGIYALDGLVETDWSTATFTMNWRFTRPNTPVVFERDEPFAMLVPQRRGELEAFTPVIDNVQDHEQLNEQFEAWRDSRSDFLDQLDPKAVNKPWQKNYFQGSLPGGNTAPEHQLKLEIRPFTEKTTSDEASEGHGTDSPLTEL